MVEVAALPAGLTSRPATEDDLDDVMRVVVADEVADRGEADTSATDVAGDWRRPSFDLATESVVVHDGDDLVAYAESHNHRSWVRVHPGHHGRGIGGALLAWAEDVARTRGDGHIGQTVINTNAAGLSLHRHRGYRERWETWLLERDLDDPVPVPAVPAGFRLRAIDRDRDARGAHAAIDEAFDTFADRDPSTFEDWHASYWTHDDLAVAQSFVVEDASGTIVGACLGVIDGDAGVVDQLAVVPAAQGHGLGGLLLLAAFAAFRDAGLGSVVLSTESRGTARSFYEHHGMRLMRSFTRFVKDL